MYVSVLSRTVYIYMYVCIYVCVCIYSLFMKESFLKVSAHIVDCCKFITENRELFLIFVKLFTPYNAFISAAGTKI